jgi:hypothetical protein
MKDFGLCELEVLDAMSQLLQSSKYEMSMKVDSSNMTSTRHLLPTSFIFQDFEQTTNSRSSSLMIPRTPKFHLWQDQRL